MMMDCGMDMSAMGGWMMAGMGLSLLLLVVLALLGVVALAKYIFAKPRAEVPTH